MLSRWEDFLSVVSHESGGKSVPAELWVADRDHASIGAILDFHRNNERDHNIKDLEDALGRVRNAKPLPMPGQPDNLAVVDSYAACEDENEFSGDKESSLELE